MDFGLSDSVAGFCGSLSRQVGTGQAGLWNQFVVPVQGQSPLAVGCLDCQKSERCADRVLGVYACVWCRCLCCELQVPRHMGASVLQRLRERTEGFGKSPEVKVMFWSERQLPQGQAKVDFAHDLAGSSYVVVSLLPLMFLYSLPHSSCTA